MDNSPNDIFIKLHLFQINLLKNISKKTINDYRDQLIELFDNEKPFNDQSDESTKLIEFLLFPVLTALKKLQNNSETKSKPREWSDLNELLLKCIYIVLEKVKLACFNLFQDILTSCSILLSQNKLNNGTSNEKRESEEFYCECFRVVQVLFDRASESLVIDKIFRFKNLTTFGLLITVFLETLCETSSIEVRLAALKSLKSLMIFDTNNYQVNKVYNAEKIHYEPRIGIIFSSFLPGISIKLVQKFLLTQNLKTLNHKIICNSLEFLGNLIAHVFNDRFLDELFFSNAFQSCLLESNDMSNEVKQLIINRSKNIGWAENSAEKISILLDQLFDALITTDDDHVKLNLVKFCSLIGNECYFTLNKHLSRILKILVTFSANEEFNIQKEAMNGLELMEQRELNNKNDDMPKRFSILSSCIEEVLLKLPRIMKNRSDFNTEIELNDNFRLSHLKTLYGYLKLIGDYGKVNNSTNLVDYFRANLQNLSQLLQALISCVSFDYKNLDNFYQIEKTSSSLLTTNSTTLSNYQGFKTYLDDQIVFEQLSLICEYLGRSNAARLLIDELLNNDLIYLQQKQNQNEIMFLINLMLKGVSKSNNDLNSIVNLVLNTFLNDFKQNTTEKLETVEDLIIAENSTMIKNRKILQTCLILESISTSSKCLEANEYHNRFLIETLYFTLENYLNTNLLIRVVSTSSLNNLAVNLKYETIQNLLSSNYDYIMNDLILKSSKQNRTIRSIKKQNTSALSSHVFVLIALLEISNSDLVPYLERLIDDYFFSIELNNSDYQIINGICSIMLTMSKSMRKWYPNKLNFLDETKCSIDSTTDQYSFENLDFKKISIAKKKDIYSKKFIQTLDDLNNSINEFKKNMEKINEETDDRNDDKDKDEFDLFPKEEPKEEAVPLRIKIQSKCLTLCTHLIAHPFKQIRLQIIELIGELSKNLVEYTNEFLPLVHKLWSTICQRFAYDDSIIKSKIIYLMFDLSVLCGDFLSSRFCKEFLPRLCVFMSEQAKLSIKSSGSKLNDVTFNGERNNSDPIDTTYIYSHSFKLQASILANIDKMCILFEIKEIELENVIDSIIIKYLDEKQPKKLQDLALAAIKNCSMIDSDVVWLCLHYFIRFSKLDNISYAENIRLKYNINLREEILLDLIKLFKSL